MHTPHPLELHEAVTATIYEEPEKQVFFGYYDITPFSHDSEIVLATRFPANAPPQLGTTAMDIGYYAKGSGNQFTKLSETTSWCWQQGCRLQWYPIDQQGRNEQIFYNTCVDGQYRGVIGNIRDPHAQTVIEHPVYAFTHDGRYGLTLDFSRLQRLRPGYGYSNLGEEAPSDAAPANSGIRVVDMQTRESSLIVSLKDMAGFHPEETMAGAEHYFNHLCAAPAGDRFLFFHLWIKDGRQYSRMITCDCTGERLHLFTKPDFVSHYWWIDEESILCYSRIPERGHAYYVYRDHQQNAEDFAPGIFNGDGHCSLSPNRKWMLTDMYPDKHGFQRLFLFNGEKTTLFKQYAPITGPVDERCDLHPRWSPDGNRIALDSIVEGKRRLVVLDVSRIVN